ncbi:DnaJ domain-containing protein [Galbitalea sp. SE-J8]|uniref:J domain-containing protein n=1 Tax=Galbitalea sp. SE-J8 TaxID=3054952 RepID=UPI00259CB721|nr:DnaJ domain-containing protein [Galbitalea sp. SE-J8]MDM4763172.1 DnaJ domain-containing protein [Galbitalea sp. SE-J8]
MTDSPMAASPYEVLGVPASATMDELRSAYRTRLRQTHPDTGGDASRFIAVQLAWERVGTPEARARYDRSSGPAADGERVSWAPAAPAPQRDSRPRARTQGHPGGWRRERYLTLLREWVGRGAEIPDPYDPVLVRSAPREIRHLLADAVAEERTARTLAALGLGFTVWHDVAAPTSDEKIDHVVLGPSGLWALLSEDYGGPVEVRRGELVGEALSGERPVAELATRARALGRAVRVRFTALAVVLPDGALTASPESLGRVRGTDAVAVAQSDLGALLRTGGSATPIGGTDLFEVRTRLQVGIRFA